MSGVAFWGSEWCQFGILYVRWTLARLGVSGSHDCDSDRVPASPTDLAQRISNANQDCGGSPEWNQVYTSTIVRFLYLGYTVRTRSSTVELDGPSKVAVTYPSCEEVGTEARH